MRLNKVIKINSYYTRSVNLERDKDSLEMISAYIPTSRARRTLESIAETFHDGVAPRAWSLVGPYGAGKSSFSIFLSHLLSAPSQQRAKTAHNVLSNADAVLAERFSSQVKGSDGYIRILITGSPEPLAMRIVVALLESAKEVWPSSKKKKPAFISKLENLQKHGEATTTELITLISEYQASIEGRAKGILLVIDELGKFLEYEARHYGANDIYLLQAIAEHACKGGNTNLYLFVLLHQSFDQYAKGLGESLKKEWSKVQGRFEEVPFLETAEQTLKVISACFEHDFTNKQSKDIKAKISNIVQTLFQEKAINSSMTQDEAVELFFACYPLHPVTAILLPYLCQRVAQNERTLFSYLGSSEQHGFKEVLNKLESIDEWVQPYHLFDYFIANQPSVASDHITSKRWAEVVTAVERLGDAPEVEQRYLKAIGILNIVGSKGGLKASEELLTSLELKNDVLARALKNLNGQSVITHRRFSNEYRVWQGSDFDIEDALEQELHKLGAYSLSDELNRKEALLPIVARRYTVENGTLRYFMPVFTDASSIKSLTQKSNIPRIIFYLASAKDDEAHFYSEGLKYFSKTDILVLVLNAPKLRDAVAEVVALGRIHSNNHDLKSDPIAKQEFEQRLTVAQRTESSLVHDLLEQPKESKWFSCGDALEIGSKRDLQVALSEILQSIYTKSPAIRNELVNRTQLSSQAAAARNKLLWAMIENADKEDLAIEKYPPEKAIYRSLLKDTGLHSKGKGDVWVFNPPAKTQPLHHVWLKIDEFLDSSEDTPKALYELGEELKQTPYGLKEGVLPILYVAALVIYKHEVALYENRQYVSSVTQEHLERLVKRPSEFTVQRFRIQGLRASIFEQYNQALYSNKKSKRTILDFARPIAEFINELPNYTKHTKSGNLSSEAKNARRAFEFAKSPEMLLFETLPHALGFDINDIDNAVVEGLAQKLTEVLRELKNCYPLFLQLQAKLLANALLRKTDVDLSTLRKEVYGLKSLINYTVDTDGLKAFLKRLASEKGADDVWLENVLMFLGQKPTHKWTDAICSESEYRLTQYSSRIVDLRALQLHEDRFNTKQDDDFDIVLLRSIKKGQAEQQQVVTIDSNLKKAKQQLQNELNDVLSQHDDKELKLAAIAEITNQYLSEYAESKKTKKVAKTEKRRKRVK